MPLLANISITTGMVADSAAPTCHNWQQKLAKLLPATFVWFSPATKGIKFTSINATSSRITGPPKKSVDHVRLLDLKYTELYSTLYIYIKFIGRVQFRLSKMASLPSAMCTTAHKLNTGTRLSAIVVNTA